MLEGDESNGAIAARLVALRDMLGKNQTAFAQMIGVTQSAMNNYEQGLRRPQIDVAQRIVKKTNVTLDWLYSGKRAGLSARLLEDLPADPVRHQA